jgi:hypothetical protein
LPFWLLLLFWQAAQLQRPLKNWRLISYGFKANTDAYSTCMMQMDLDQQQQDRDQRRRIGAALAGMGAAMATPTRSAVTCNTFGNARRSSFGTYGNSTTTCY